MKHKVAELDGALLDAAVALADGWKWWRNKRGGITVERPGCMNFEHGNNPARYDEQTGERLPEQTLDWLIVDCGEVPPFSTEWAHGGPLIERERITMHAPCESGTYAGVWNSQTEWGRSEGFDGPTPLIAAMRAFVASKLGEEVELP